MKALTVQPPWSWAIAAGYKDVENRSTLWRHRGPLAIHAGTRLSTRGLADHRVDAVIRPIYDRAPDKLDRTFWNPGHVIAVTTVVDVHRCSDGCCESEWAEESYVEHGGTLRGDVVHLVLADTVELTTPVPCGGRLGLWTMPADAAGHVKDQLFRHPQGVTAC